MRDLRAELLKAEAAHFAKTKGTKEEPSSPTATPKRRLEGAPDGGDIEDEDPEAKRRRILEETRDIDADSDGAADDSSSDEDRCVALSSPSEICAYRDLVMTKRTRPRSS